MAEEPEKLKPDHKRQGELNIETYERIYRLCYGAATKIASDLAPGRCAETDAFKDHVAELFFTRFWDDQMSASKNDGVARIVEQFRAGMLR